MTRELPETDSLSFQLLSARIEAAFDEISESAALLRSSLELRLKLISQQRGTIERFRELKAQTLAYWRELPR